MKSTLSNGIAAAAASLIALAHPFTAGAQPSVPLAGQPVMTSVTRLNLNPANGKALVIGYYSNIAGLPGLLFNGAPGETTAFFTWSQDNSTAGPPITNGDTTVVPFAGATMNIYFSPNPSSLFSGPRNWNNTDSFAQGQLVAVYKASGGAGASSGPTSHVVQGYTLVSSSDFTFNGQTYNFRYLVPHGFVTIAYGSNVPLAGAGSATYPLVFTFGGTNLAIGGALSSLPLF